MPSPNVFSYNAMLLGYSKQPGLLHQARKLFDRMPDRDLVSWNTMIIALARSGSSVEFYSRLRRTPLGVNPHTFSGLLAACVRLADRSLARQVHAQLLLAGYLSNLIIGSSLVDAYSKCRCLDDSRKVFDEMPVRDVTAWTTLVYGYARWGDLSSARRIFDRMPERNPISWTALIGGYARSGFSVEALDLFREMMGEDVRPDQFTFSSSLCACASVASLKHGKQIHARLIRTQFDPNPIVLSSLIDMYSKSGDLVRGRRIFDRTAIGRRDVVMWNTVISAVGQHGHGKTAIRMFEEMIGAKMRPDSNTFVVLLTACSHSGLATEGVQFFESMEEKYGVRLEEEHFVCLVDLLGRAGRFKEALGWIRKMTFRPSDRIWNAFLGACRIHGRLKLGSEAAERLIQSEPRSSSAYVLLSNIYAEAGKWESVEKVRQRMEELKVRKEQATSWIDINDTVHSLGASDELHPLKEEICDAMEQLICQTNIADSSIT